MGGAAQVGRPTPERARIELLPFAFLVLAALSFALVVPIRRLGDASDYAIATESLLYDHDLQYTRQDLERNAAAKPFDFTSPAGLHTVVGREGRTYLGAHHSFYYSLAAVPFYAVFGYRGFLLFNALLFCAFALVVYLHLRDENDWRVAWTWTLLALLFSASWTYVAWIHTEVFYMALLGFFLFAWERGRPVLAALPLGLAAAAQPTLLPLVPIFFLIAWREGRGLRQLAAMAAVTAAAILPQLGFNLYAFHALHPVWGTNEVGLEFMSLTNFARSWLDPVAGIVWFYPAVVVAAVEAPRNRFTAWMWAGSALVILCTTASHAWYSHQVGLRYGSWILALIVFTVRRVSFTSAKALAAWAFAIVVGTGLAVNPLGNSTSLDPSVPTFLPYQMALHLPWYPERGDVLWYRTRPIAPDVRATEVWPDGWVPGGRWETLLVLRGSAEPLDLGLGTWQKTGEQQVELRTASGRSFRYRLPAKTVAAVSVPLAHDDLWWTPGEPTGWIVLQVRAERWTPLGQGLEISDYRGLGVQIDRVAQGQRVLFQR